MAIARFGIVLSLALTAQGFPTYQQRIPNGASVMVNGVGWPGVGHLASGGGGARNVFGLAFQSAGLAWTTSLCQADSDGDGETNGEELGDPSCTWTVGQSDPIKTSGTITHPGLAESNSIPPPVAADLVSPEESLDEASPTSSPSKMPTVGPSVPLTNINPVTPTPPLVVSPVTPIPPVIAPVPLPVQSPPVPMQPGGGLSSTAAIVLSLIAVALLAVLLACAFCPFGKKDVDGAERDQEQDNPPLPNIDQQQYGEHTNSMGQALDGREMYSAPPLQPGQQVRAMYLDGQTYDATIRGSGVDSYAVEWYDGSYSGAVPQQHVTPINPLSNFSP